MKRSTLIVGALVCALMPVVIHADDMAEDINVLDCGVIQKRNGSWQFGPYAWLEYLVETQGYVNLCGQWVVAVEAHVAGVENSGASTASLIVASVRRQILVPYYGRYTTSGQHWATVSFYPGFLSMGGSSSQADVVPPAPDEPDADRALECAQAGGEWDGDHCAYPNCPLIVDTAHDGYKLTNVADGVRFDLNADGVPELVAWTQPGSDDAFLAMDRNGNGRIDDGTELFGNRTPAYADRSDVTTANGFEALRFIETMSYGASRRDNVIDSNDAPFGRLLLWRDANHNGVSEPEELQPVAGSGIVAIQTDYKTSKRHDRYGNEFRQRGAIAWQYGEDAIFDVWLRWQD